MNEPTLKEQLSDVQQEVKHISRQLIELTTIHNMSLDERKNNNNKIEKLENDFLTVRGGVNLLKGLMTIIGSALIAFCTWIVSTNFQTNQDMAVHKDKQERIIQDVNRLHDKVEYLENEVTKYKNSH